MEGAHGVLLSIYGGSDLGLFEINDAASLVAEAAHPDANIIFGAVIDDTLGDEVKVTVIAAGFDSGQLPYKKVEVSPRRRTARLGAGPGARAGAERTGPDAAMATSFVWHRPDPARAGRRAGRPRLPQDRDRRESGERAAPTRTGERSWSRARRGCSGAPRRRPARAWAAIVPADAGRSHEGLPGQRRRPDLAESGSATSVRVATRRPDARSPSSMPGGLGARSQPCGGTSSGRCRPTSAGRGPLRSGVHSVDRAAARRGARGGRATGRRDARRLRPGEPRRDRHGAAHWLTM